MKKFIGFFVVVCLLVTITVSWSAYHPDWTWTPPTQNEDGTPLTDLGGYEIGCGDSVGNYTRIVDVGNITRYIDDGTLVPAGLNSICAVRAYDTSLNRNTSIWSTDDGGSDLSDNTPPGACGNFKKNNN